MCLPTNQRWVRHVWWRKGTIHMPQHRPSTLPQLDHVLLAGWGIGVCMFGSQLS
jgi:hypothetical protein